jgi:mannose-6-phosphate isomerase-like protein (cupin superfamily)
MDRAWRKKKGRDMCVKGIQWPAVVAIAACFCFQSARGAEVEKKPEKPQAKLIRLDAGDADYLRLLGGPPESAGMRSGLVVLQPGKSVGKHSTEAYEEMIVVLEGSGKMILADGRELAFAGGAALYCPPDTEHDMINTGSVPLRYVYIVAKTR